MRDQEFFKGCVEEAVARKAEDQAVARMYDRNGTENVWSEELEIMELWKKLSLIVEQKLLYYRLINLINSIRD